METKECTMCHIVKTYAEFRYSNNGRSLGRCRECQRAIEREYRRSDRGKEKARQWVKNNRDRMAKLQSDWHQNNKDYINQKYNERYHSDPLFKLQRNCKKRIQDAFKSKGLCKSGKTLNHINCTMSWLVEWFTFCFDLDPNMTLDNHGTYWHMDHVIPVNKWNLDDYNHKVNCFSWFNLSPLKGSDNISKHDTINMKQITKHCQKLLDFTWEKNIWSPHEYIDFCARHLRMTGNPLELYLPIKA